MQPFKERSGKDRRKQPTPGLSRYTFFGRREGFRRKVDQGQAATWTDTAQDCSSF